MEQKIKQDLRIGENIRLSETSVSTAVQSMEIILPLPSENFTSTQALSILNSQQIIFPFISGIDAGNFSLLPNSSAELLGVGSRQAEGQTAFFNLKGQTALLIVIGLFAALGILLCKDGQPILEVSVVGLNLDHLVIFVKIDGCCLLVFRKTCFHKNLLLQ